MSTDQLIIEYLNKNPKWNFVIDISRDLGINRHKVNSCLKILEKNKKIEKIEAFKIFPDVKKHKNIKTLIYRKINFS